MSIGEVNVSDAVRSIQGSIPVLKAQLLTGSSSDGAALSNQTARDEWEAAIGGTGILEPLYDPEMLSIIFEHSNSMRQNVDAYATNIDGFGHRFDPELDLDASDIDHRIANAIYLDRQRESPEEDPAYPTEQEVAARKKQIAHLMRGEKSRLQYFFEFCSPDISFVRLRRITRQDIEVTGNAFWEVLRNRAGAVAQFVYMAGHTVRLLPLDAQPITVTQRIRVSELSFEQIEMQRRVRRYVQVVDGRTVFFKDFGDPRFVSSKTGSVYASLNVLQAREPGVAPATEVIHFKIHSSRSAYGVPRWIGNLLAVLGSRQSEEVNFTYFENKSVPPLAILVSGGRMSTDSIARTQEYIEQNIKGKRNFHKILILEAEGAGSPGAADSGKMKIDIRPLTGAQHSDALFQNYDERNIDKVGQSFRLPKLLRGDIRDFNRSTADAALTFAEMQVFQPERADFDYLLNHKILSAMGIKFFRFVSLAPIMRDPVAMSEIIKNFANANVLTPEEARELASDVFNREFRHLKAPWVKQPAAFTLAGLGVQEEDPSVLAGPTVGEGTPASGGDAEAPLGAADAATDAGTEAVAARARKKLTKALAVEAGRLLALRDALRRADAEAWTRTLLEKVNQG